jgi:hypothetical protein
MDEFRTKVEIPGSPEKIGYIKKCLFMGSCFSDYIGRIMADYKYPLLMNPFGTLFNPLSIADNTDILIKGSPFSEADLHYHDGLWFSFSHYTGFSDPQQSVSLDKINTSLLLASEWLQKCDFLVLTFGTAWAYYLKETGKVAANCHKLPSAAFNKQLLKPGTIFTRYHKLITVLRQLNPNLVILFTLSPVRHWADGAVNNQLSKSVLHFAIQEIIRHHPGTWYFPAYEIFMDELRDYRFYASDMLHPSETGTGYVWKRFSEAWIDTESNTIAGEIAEILKAVGHRPKNPESAAHQKFKHNTIKRINELKQRYSFLDFSKELALL